jgi:hypothetical protein
LAHERSPLYRGWFSFTTKSLTAKQQYIFLSPFLLLFRSTGFIHVLCQGKVSYSSFLW